MICNKHEFRRGERDLWYCIICGKKWVSYETSRDLYEQIKQLKAENLRYRKAFRVLKQRLDLSLLEK